MTMRIGMDIGGTKCAVGSFNEDNLTKELYGWTFAVSGNFEVDYKHIRNAVQQLISLSDQELTGIGIAIPGILNDKRTDLVNAANLPHWVGKGIVYRLYADFGVPVALGNDLEAQALAEAYYGNGQEQDFLQIGWGTGIGSAFVRRLGGHTYVFPCEVGHSQVDPSDFEHCPCGQTGCLECFAGGAGIERYFGLSAAEASDQQWSQILGWMAIGIKNAIMASPAKLVVLSGGVATNQANRLPELKLRLEKIMKVYPAPALALSAFGSSSGTIGASSLLNQL